MVVGDTRMLGTLHPTQWKKWNTWTIENNGSGLSGLIRSLVRHFGSGDPFEALALAASA
jgi:hypothetical protein